MKTFFSLIASCLMVGSVEAALLTFDDQPEQFHVGSVSEDQYIFSSNADGLGTSNNPLWASNGTRHLMSWTNQGASSGFDLSHRAGSLFDVLAFDFAGGYFNDRPDWRAPELLTLSGWRNGEQISSATFRAGTDFFNGAGYSTLSLLSFTGIDLLRAEAEGFHNRASFDNFVVHAEGETHPIPAPASLALVLLGLAGLLASSRRRQ